MFLFACVDLLALDVMGSLFECDVVVGEDFLGSDVCRNLQKSPAAMLFVCCRGLNGNKINGQLPAELGKTNLTWLDISTNKISGPIPIANATNPIGLDNLTTIVHL